MGWKEALFGHLTMWSSNKKRSSDSESSSSSSYHPVFAVDRTEIATATTTGVQELTLRKLNKATSSFSAAMHIGQGCSAMVYRAMLPIGNGKAKAAAVAKRLGHLSSGTSWSASDDEFLRQQVLVLSRLRHDNVVRLLGYTIDTAADIRVLLFEFADMGTLHDVLHGPTTGESAADEPGSSSRPALTTTLSWAQRTSIALDVARGLEYLHNTALASHWGICSRKVLLFHSQGLTAKIADYDLFKQLPPDGQNATKEVSWYYPPEYVMTGFRRSRKFDVYSYGVLLVELLTGMNKCPSGSSNLLQWAAPILREGRVDGFMDPRLGTQYPPARALKLAQIALCCVQDNPRSRPSMGEVAQIISCYIVSSKTSLAK